MKPVRTSFTLKCRVKSEKLDMEEQQRSERCRKKKNAQKSYSEAETKERTPCYLQCQSIKNALYLMGTSTTSIIPGLQLKPSSLAHSFARTYTPRDRGKCSATEQRPQHYSRLLGKFQQVAWKVLVLILDCIFLLYDVLLQYFFLKQNSFN